jgi:hypothetical protein
MRKIKTSDIAGAAGMRVKKGTLDHLQTSYKEIAETMVRARIGDSYSTSAGYLLYGLKRTGTGLVFNVTAGALFLNGEIYLVDSFSFTAAVGETAVGTITTTYFTDPTADPVQFSDGSNKNIHEIRKIVFASGTAGSGSIDFVNIIQQLEAADFIDVTSSLTFHASLSGITKEAYRFKDGTTIVKVAAALTANIAAIANVVSNIPPALLSQSQLTAEVRNGTTYSTWPLSIVGTNIRNTAAFLSAVTWDNINIYAYYKSTN